MSSALKPGKSISTECVYIPLRAKETTPIEIHCASPMRRNRSSSRGSERSESHPGNTLRYAI